MTDQPQSVLAPGLKIASAWAAVGITSWSDVAAILASAYTALLIGEWFWKKVWRSFCEERGWVKRAKRRKDDA
jgi:hypothetical protein